MDIEQTLSNLAKHRPVFHSESDFQHALAWEIQRFYPDAQIRLEHPIRGLSGRASADILVRNEELVLAFELKYFKSALNAEVKGETYHLPSGGAQDISRYDFCKDLGRLEFMVGTDQADIGYAIALGNDSSFWRPGLKESSIDALFKIHDGRSLKGSVSWTEQAGLGTTKGRELPIHLVGEYTCGWQEYSLVEGARNGRFRSLTIQVTKGPKLSLDQQPVKSQGQLTRRYEPLRQFFKSVTDDNFELAFEQIEQMVGALPSSAYNHSAWWYHRESHPQAVWEEFGFKASPQLARKAVMFRKIHSN